MTRDARIRYFIVFLGISCHLASCEKPNRCPRSSGSGTCVESCSNDESCPGTKKCCYNGCGHDCIRPVVDDSPAFLKPDFVSSWYNMTAQAGINTTLVNIEHGLGETPLLVDVQVKVDSGDNAGFIFPGSGCRIRDDDRIEGYGGIVYLYNDVYVEISSPTTGNHHLGRIIYTGFEPYWKGAYYTDSYTAQVRARAWRASSLPPPDSNETDIRIVAQISNGSYVERSHDLGEIPALVISRLKFPSDNPLRPNYYSDSVGASMAMYDDVQYEENGFVVHGFNNNSIRAWGPSLPGDALFVGGDGWNFIHQHVTVGKLEFYSWRASTLNPSHTSYLPMGLGSTQFTQAFSMHTNEIFTKAWVQALDGPNDGFRFAGNGNLAYATESLAAGCSYGGIVYAYSEQEIRFWRPGPGQNNSGGALVCIADNMGGGVNVQASSDGNAVYSVWTLAEDYCSPDPCENGICTNYALGYNCSCDVGYSGTNCETEKDECVKGSEACDVNAICEDTVGSYTCTCMQGFFGNGTSCSDVDECTAGTDNCDVNAVCANTLGNYTCTCNIGYNGNGYTCTDVDECTAGTDNCDVNAVCANTLGSFTCTCNIGYNGTGNTCTDVDECTAGTDNCDVNAVCANTLGSFTCTCNIGYNGTGNTCTDVDECTAGTDNCDVNAVCANTLGSFTCTCNIGYNGTGNTCTDVDECTAGTDNCDVNAVCANTLGSFTCTCNIGYNGTGNTCTDVDECTAGTDNCDVNAVCANTLGSFTCTCNIGYNGTGNTCTDVDECTAGTDNCDVNAVCANTLGSFTCTCNIGYNGTGNTCTDVDECTAGTDNCDVNAVCANTLGNYTCTCNIGYNGNGYTCTGSDKCMDGNNNCNMNAVCTNTSTGFTCVCDTARSYYGDGVNCSLVLCKPDGSIDVYDLPADQYHYALQNDSPCSTTNINSTAVTITGCSKDLPILLAYGSYSDMESNKILGGKSIVALRVMCTDIPVSGRIHTVNNTLTPTLTIDEEGTVNPTFQVSSSLNISYATAGSPAAWTIYFPVEYILEVTECWAYPGTDDSSSEYISLVTSGGCNTISDLISSFTDNMDGTATAVIRVFKFYVSHHVFLKCNLKICSSELSSCDTGCSRAKRSDTQIQASRETRGIWDSYSATIENGFKVFEPYSSATIPGAGFATVVLTYVTVSITLM